MKTKWLLNHSVCYIQISGKILTLILPETFSNSNLDAEAYQIKITPASRRAFSHHVIFQTNWKDGLLKHKQDSLTEPSGSGSVALPGQCDAKNQGGHLSGCPAAGCLIFL